MSCGIGECSCNTVFFFLTDGYYATERSDANGHEGSDESYI